MITNEQLKLLIANPGALERFCDLLTVHSTVIGLEQEISKISESLRAHLCAARFAGIDPSGLLKYCRAKDHERLNMCARAIGIERGRRVGKQAAERTILEARHFGQLQAQRLIAPWPEAVEPIDDD